MILPGLGLEASYRYLLGPAQLMGHVIKSATVQYQPSGQWTVTFRFTPSGAIAWNAMAQRYFHEVVAIDLGGVVQFGANDEPDVATFVSFGDSVQVSSDAGNFTRFQAQKLASAVGAS